MRTYLMTRALGALGRTPGESASGVVGAADGSVMTGPVITRRTLSSTFLATDTMALRAAVGAFVHRLLLIFHCLPSSFAREPLGETSHRRGELVQPGL